MRASVFTVGQWSIGVAAAAVLGSMLVYPGGTFHDPSTHRYSLFNNFLSDLGMTVAHDGRSNSLGALLFVLGLIVIVIGLGMALVRLVRLYSGSPAARPYAGAAAVVGLLVCLAFAGVALTPENKLLDLHIWLTLFAFRVFPVASLLFVFASLRSELFPRRMAIAWASLTVVLTAYVIMLGWGPDVATDAGLTVQVAAQKIVAVIAGGVFFYLCTEAKRVIAAETSRIRYSEAKANLSGVYPRGASAMKGSG
jgi:hypothetical protein